VTEHEDELRGLIRRGQRSRLESRRILVAASQLIDERRRLRGMNRVLFRDLVDLTRRFVNEVERQTSHPAENQN
jgi:hypothetical protein